MNTTIINKIEQNNWLSLKSGALAGSLIFLFLLLTNASPGETGHLGKFLKYAILLVTLGITFQFFANAYEGKYFFRNALLIGIRTTLITTLTLIIANFIYWGYFYDLPVDTFQINDQRFGKMLVLQGATLMEMFVGGMICTFILLQLFKGR